VRSRSARSSVATGAAVVHDAALLVAVFYAPIVWGSFNAGGQAFAVALVGIAALAALAARWSQGRTPAVIPNALHLPALVFLGISAVSAAFVSVSRHASLLELTRIATGVLLFWLVANRALLPAAPARPVAIAFSCSVVLVLFVRIPSEPSAGLSMLSDPDFLELLFRGAGAALRLFALVGVGVVAALILVDKERAGPLRWYLCALITSAALVVAVYGLREKLLTYYVLNNKPWSIFSTFFNPNPLGGFLAMALSLAAGTALAAARWWRRALWGAAALLLLAAIIPTHSRGAMLALSAAILIFVVLAAGMAANRRRNLRILAAFGIAAVLAAACALSVAPSVRARAAAVFGGQSASNMFRLLTWQGAARMALHHPLLGIGPGGFEYAFMRHAIAGYTRAAHQTYLQVAAEQGFLGLAAFLWLLGAALFAARRALARGRDFRDRMLTIGAISALAALLVHSFLDYDWYIGAIGLVFWLLLGLLAHQAHGRQVEALVPEPQEVPKPKGRAARRAGVPAATPEVGAHRLPWPRGAAGRDLLAAGFALVILLCFLTPLRSALAQNALAAGVSAYGAALRAFEQSDTMGMGHYMDLALADYQRATRYDPGWARAWEHYGLLLGHMGRTEEGEQAIRRALRLEPTNFQPWSSLAALYSLAGRHSDAVKAYQQALARYPSYTRALRRLAQSYQQLGDLERALSVYRRMLEVEQSPYNKYRALDDIDVDTEYAYAHYQVGRAAAKGQAAGSRPDALPVAVHEYQETLAVIDAYWQRAKATDEMFRQVGQPREDRAGEMKVLEGRTRWRLADALEKLGYRAEASRERELALQVYPEVASVTAVEDGGKPG